ncbi:MAG: hypothetical protein EXX96DRAFT_536313 [Benjaminiella poitrasii]|nr:MAG: hypothetical protein EXX96DRAFT_536313 [Benjaminiella poitrasii]
MFMNFHISTPPNSVLENPRLIWHLSKLYKPSIRAQYNATFQQKHECYLQDFLKTDHQPTTLTSAQTFIEDFSSAICSAIYNSLDMHCGQKQHWHDPLYVNGVKKHGDNSVINWHLITTVKRFDASFVSNEDGRVKPIFTIPSGLQDASNTMAQRLQHSFNGDICPNSPPPLNDLSSLIPFVNDPPFTIDSINTVMNILQSSKASGVNHLRIETLRPL